MKKIKTTEEKFAASFKKVTADLEKSSFAAGMAMQGYIYALDKLEKSLTPEEMKKSAKRRKEIKEILQEIDACMKQLPVDDLKTLVCCK